MNKIYLVTTLMIRDGEKDIERSRSVGYYFNLNDAIETIKENNCDIYEYGYYNYALIEEIEEGLYQYDIAPKWYKVITNDGRTYQINSCKTPEGFEHVVGLGIG